MCFSDSVVVRSITRGCGTQPSLDCGRNCCSTDIHWRTCLSQCLANNEFCNDKDKSVTVIAKGPSGGAASITNLFTWSLTVCTLVLFVLYWTETDPREFFEGEGIRNLHAHFFKGRSITIGGTNIKIFRVHPKRFYWIRYGWVSCVTSFTVKCPVQYFKLFLVKTR